MRRSAASVSIGLIAASSLLLGCDDGSPATGPAPSIEAPTLTGLLVEPLVVWRGSESARITATASGPSVSALNAIHVHLLSTYAVNPNPVWPDQELLQDGVPVTRIQLVDDGTGGDAVAGDGTFTSRPIGLSEVPVTPVASTYPMYVPQVDWEFADTLIPAPRAPEDRIRVVFHDADPAAIDIPPIEELAPDARRTPHVISLAVTDPSAAFAGETLDGMALSQEYFSRFDYEPDFLITYQLPPRRTGGFEGQLAGVRNDIEGLGISLYSNDAIFGSSGRLKAVVVIRNAPNPVYHYLVIHELNHTWAAFLDPALGISDSGHWTRGLDRPVDGFSGGPFNDLELYLMGLLPADSVSPRQIGTSGSTIDDLVAIHGARSPAWPDAQTEFTAATVIAHHRLLEPVELALFDWIAAELGWQTLDPRKVDPRALTFFQATGGRARLVTRIPDP